MDKNNFWKYVEQLKPGQGLVVFADLEVKIYTQGENYHGKSTRKFLHFGKIENSIPETIIPIKNKPWGKVRTKGKKSFSHFGQVLPKYMKKDDNSAKIRKWTMAFNMLKSMEFEPKKGKWSDSQLQLSYDTEELNGIKVYYFKGTPRYVEFQGEKLIIPQLVDDNKNKLNVFFDVKDE